MPGTLGAIITSALAITETGATVIVGSITVNTVIGAAVLVGAEIGLSALLAPSAAQGSNQQQFNIRQPVPARRRYYGRNKAGGYVAFSQVANSNLYRVILVAAHEVSFVEHWIGDRLIALDGSGNVTTANMVDAGNYRFHILPKVGTNGQTSHALLVSDFASLWTTDHRLAGIANVLFKQDSVEAKKFLTFYPGGPQLYRAVFDGSRVYNVLNVGQNASTPAGWDIGADNAANVIRDYLTHSDGMRLPWSALSPAFDEWQEAATICNEVVIHADTTTDSRYRLCGGYDLTAAPKDQLPKFLAACDGQLAMRGDGALTLKVGKWSNPAVTIGEDHIRSFSLPKGVGPLRLANEIRATYTDPNQDYQPTEAEPWRDDDDISARGETKSRTIDLTYVPTHNQARRLMKIEAYRSNPERVGTITTDLAGLALLGDFPETIRSKSVQAGLLVKFSFISGAMGLWNGNGELTTNDGQVWKGLRGLGSVSGLEQAINSSAPQAVFSVSGVGTDWQREEQGDPFDYVNQPVNVYLQFFSANWTPLDAPCAIWGGTMQTLQDSFGWDDSKKAWVSTIGVTAESWFSGRGRPPFSFYSSRDQKGRFPGDRGCEYMAQMQNHIDRWPATS